MADKYISREAAENAISRLSDKPNDWIGKENAINAVDAIPAADVVPVVHSHWEDVSVKITLTVDDEGSMLIASMFCPNCKRWHNEVYHYGSPTEMAHYCPNCGAKMDEEGDGE